MSEDLKIRYAYELIEELEHKDIHQIVINQDDGKKLIYDRREKTQWILCSERLPEKWGDYLVTSKWKGVGSGTVYIETNMAVYNKRAEKWEHPDVIAWMPLPEPYTESEG